MAMKAKGKNRGARHDPLDKQVLEDRHPEHKKTEKPSKVTFLSLSPRSIADCLHQGETRAKKREQQPEYISEDLSRKILSQAR